jgi:hypothetical protein
MDSKRAKSFAKNSERSLRRFYQLRNWRLPRKRRRMMSGMQIWPK